LVGGYLAALGYARLPDGVIDKRAIRGVKRVRR
jgi:hypothetical protein